MLNKRLTCFVGLVDKSGTTLEDKLVISVAAKTFAKYGWAGFTVSRHMGYWNGEPEASLSFMVLFDSAQVLTASPQHLAADLASLFNQEAVLYSVETVWAELVESLGQ